MSFKYSNFFTYDVQVPHLAFTLLPLLVMLMIVSVTRPGEVQGCPE